MQPGDEGINLSIHYASFLLTIHEQNYTIIEHEGLAMIYAIKKFCHYLLGSYFVFFIDHTTLVDLINKPQIFRRIFGCMLLLSEFDYEVVYKLGKIHFIPDALSRFNLGEPAIGISMQLPDEGLYEINEVEVTSGLSLAHVSRVTIEDKTLLTCYLTSGLFSLGLREQEQRIYA